MTLLYSCATNTALRCTSSLTLHWKGEWYGQYAQRKGIAHVTSSTGLQLCMLFSWDFWTGFEFCLYYRALTYDIWFWLRTGFTKGIKPELHKAQKKIRFILVSSYFTKLFTSFTSTLCILSIPIGFSPSLSTSLSIFWLLHLRSSTRWLEPYCLFEREKSSLPCHGKLRQETYLFPVLSQLKPPERSLQLFQ